jgi:hypothetical protein
LEGGIVEMRGKTSPRGGPSSAGRDREAGARCARAVAEVQALLGDAPRRRDLLIEHLHLIQDRYGCTCRRRIWSRSRAK